MNEFADRIRQIPVTGKLAELSHRLLIGAKADSYGCHTTTIRQAAGRYQQGRAPPAAPAAPQSNGFYVTADKRKVKSTTASAASWDGGRTENGVAGYFGKQLRKERLKAKLTITELARRMGMDDAHLGRIERGLRPPTEAIAARADEVFASRDGWFADYYRESRSWVPAAFKAWQEYEDKASRLSVWSPGIVHGLAQTPAYARAILSVSGASD